ncbi:MAG: DUF2807 domain-containing protein [Bacteroidales bacterium]|nr:DUF2807 domain-containing protein [Bacteroidales bacterium]
MKKAILLVSVLTLALLRVFGNTDNNDPIEDKIFTSINCDGRANIYISQSDKYDVKIEDETPDKICKVEIKDNILYVTTRNTKNKLNNQKKINVYVTCPNLEEIDYSGVGSVEIADGVNYENDFRIKYNGVGSVMIPKFECKNLNINYQGTGSVKTGEINCQYFNMKHGGVGAFNASEITSSEIEIRQNGVGQMDFKATCNNLILTKDGTGKVSMEIDCDNLNIRNNGIGNVDVKGKVGAVDIQKNGIGKINTSELEFENKF